MWPKPNTQAGHVLEVLRQNRGKHVPVKTIAIGLPRGWGPYRAPVDMERIGSAVRQLRNRGYKIKQKTAADYKRHVTSYQLVSEPGLVKNLMYRLLTRLLAS